ncbi:MAG: hypothetical protein WCD35_18465 [Mycobacteriales bacterium]
MRTGTQVVLTRARSVAVLRQDLDVPFLDVRSSLPGGPSLLLPVPAQRVLAGLSLDVPVGRWQARCWALAYGAGPLPDDCLVRFDSGGLRFRRTVDVTPQRLGRTAWVADAEGIYTGAALLCSEVETASVALAARW